MLAAQDWFQGLRWWHPILAVPTWKPGSTYLWNQLLDHSSGCDGLKALLKS